MTSIIKSNIDFFKKYLSTGRVNQTKNIFYDIETFQYNEKAKKPSDIKNKIFSFQFAYIYQNDIYYIILNNFLEFLDIFNYNNNVKGNIKLIGHNINKYDNHYLLNELNELAFKHQNKNQKSRKQTQDELVVTTSRVKAKTQLELSFTYNKINFVTEDTLPKTVLPLVKLGKKLVDNKFLPPEYSKGEDFDYTKYNKFNDMSDMQVKLYSKVIFDNLTEKELIYCRNDVVILASLFLNFDSVFYGFEFKYRTQSQNIMKRYLTSDLSAFQLKNETSLNKKDENFMHLKYSNYDFDNMNLYDYINNFYKGGLNFYNDKYIGVILKDMFSIDINSSYPTAMYNEKIPIFLQNYYYDKKIFQNLDDNKYYLFKISFQSFNKILKTIKSIVFRKMLVKYFNNMTDYIYLTSIHIDIILDIMHGSIDNIVALSCLEFETHYFDSRNTIKGFYKIKQQGKSKKILDFSDMTNIKVTEKDNTILLDDSEIGSSKVNLNGIYGLPAIKPHFNLFEEDENGDIYNIINGFDNKERNVMFSLSITSFALRNLLSPLRNLDYKDVDKYVYYTDTDSIYLSLKIKDKLYIKYDKNSLGTWDIENSHISKFFMLNHKKYAYVSENYDKDYNTYIHVRCGGVRKDTFDLSVDFENFINNQFSNGVTISTLKSILNKQGTISLYNSDTILSIGKPYKQLIYKNDKEELREIKEEIKTYLLENDISDGLYFETPYGVLSEKDIFYKEQDLTHGNVKHIINLTMEIRKRLIDD